MIFALYIIEGENWLLVFKKLFSEIEKDRDVYNHFSRSTEDIQHFLINRKDSSDFTRILMETEYVFVFYYYSEGNLLVSCITSVDDETEQVLHLLQALARRFWLKHRFDISLYYKSLSLRALRSFEKEVCLVTLNGKTAEKRVFLVVNHDTLNHLKSLGVINDVEARVASICEQALTPSQISKRLSLGYDRIEPILEKLRELDICRY